MGVNVQLLVALSAVLLLTYTAGVGGDETTKEVCSQQKLEARCFSNQYIYISSAWYGRKKGMCVTTWSKDCGCDATKNLRNHCAGLRNCTIEVLDKYFPCKSTCARDYTQHLYVTYGCGDSAQPHIAMSASQRTWIIVGGIAGGVVFIIIVGVACRCWQQRNYNEDAESTHGRVYYHRENRDPPHPPSYAVSAKKSTDMEDTSTDSIAKDKYIST